MKFIVDCDRNSGLVLVDKSFLDDMDSELLYSMDILLDCFGKTELIYDFPSEHWKIVRERESNAIKSFCNSGKMILNLLPSGEHQCEFHLVDDLFVAFKWLHMPTGNLLAVTADELIQCVAYPDLEMEKIFELQLEKGWYAFSNNSEGEILCCRKFPPKPPFDNIQEISNYEEFYNEAISISKDDVLRDIKNYNNSMNIHYNNSLSCPHCKVNSDNIRFIDRSPDRKSVFICRICGRSFGIDEIQK